MKNIIFEDDHIIVVYKPAGIATQTARLGQQDMVSELKNYLAKKPEHKSNDVPYLGVVHRLDQPVSGILVFARTKQAAAELSRQVTNGQMQKYYYAVIYGAPAKELDRLEDYLYKDGKTNQSQIVKADFPNAKKAVLDYRLIKTLMAYGESLSESHEISLMEIELITGRHHQIRVQMSHAGMSLLGDSKYGNCQSKDLSQQIGCRGVALCAYKLEFIHPVTREKVTFEKKPDSEIFLPFFTKGI